MSAENQISLKLNQRFLWRGVDQAGRRSTFGSEVASQLKVLGSPSIYGHLFYMGHAVVVVYGD